VLFQQLLSKGMLQGGHGSSTDDTIGIEALGLLKTYDGILGFFTKITVYRAEFIAELGQILLKGADIFSLTVEL
jgi:hypothetical protein